MKTVTATPSLVLPLGRMGENEYTQIKFDVSGWLAELPSATIGLYNQRPHDADAYPVDGITVQDGIVTWTITSAELAQVGKGRCELVAMENSVVAKSAIYNTIIFDALDGSGEAPDPWDSWQETFEQLKAAAVQAAQDAEEAVEHYPRIVNGIWQVWDVQTGAWVSTGVHATGADGQDGADGVSPTVSVTDITGGHRVTITDAEGQHTFDVMDGEDGTEGTDGQDGFSPSASVTQTATGATISITDKQGTTTANIENGTDGTDGEDGYSPTVTVTDITGGHRVTVTDADGAHSFDVMDGTGSVQDVRVNGVSVLDAQGVANVPLATSSVPGVVKVISSYGVALNSANALQINYASEAQCKNQSGSTAYQPLTVYTQKAASFYGFAAAAGDTTQSASSNAVGTYTDAAKVAIQKMLGVYREWELIAEETVAEDSAAYDIATDLAGQPFALSEMYVRVWLKPSTTGTNDYMSARALVITKADATSSVSAPTKRYMASGAASFFDYHCQIFGGVTYCTGTASSSAGGTGAVERITSNDDIYKAFRGFRMQQYGASTSLIPKDTVIKIYGIRA